MSNHDKDAAAYSAVGVPLDQLPYTLEMDRIVSTLNKAEGELRTHREVWHDLVDLRKRGKLPKVGRTRHST